MNEITRWVWEEKTRGSCKLPHLSLLIILCHFSWLQWNITAVTHPFALSTRTLSLCCPILLVPLHPTIPIVWHFPKEMKHLSLCPFTLPPRDPNSFSEVPQHLFQPGLHSIYQDDTFSPVKTCIYEVAFCPAPAFHNSDLKHIASWHFNSTSFVHTSTLPFPLL